MRSISPTTFVLRALFVALFASALMPVVAEAGALRANVFLTQSKIPSNLNEKGLLGFARSHKAARMRETTEPNLDERKWLAEMITQFNAPPGDLEFHVLFYDVTDGARQFIEDMSVFVDDRSQKVFVSKVKLPRPRFKPNRRLELVVTVRRAEVGSLKVIVDGEEKRHSGVVDFGNGT